MERTFYIAEINGDTSFQHVTLQINPPKIYILVAGIDYHTGNSFIKYCSDYKNKIIASNKNKEVLTFITVDFKGNIVTVTDGKIILTEEFDKISKSNYPASKGHAFDFLGKTNYITKKKIYELIEEIGKTNPNTLEEVNIFSHAYSGGPILGNSSEKDVNDLDMRINDVKNKIFDYTNFKNAFSNTGIFKIWGCQSHPPFNYLIKRVMQNSKYKMDGTTLDTDEFIINDIAIPGHEILSKYIDIADFKLLSNGKIMVTLLQTKRIFAKNYRRNFAAWIAHQIDIKVQYSLPATYASFGSPEVFRISDDTKMNVPFFETYLGITIGESNYGVYDKSTVDKLLKL
jgi:hypothetical protein